MNTIHKAAQTEAAPSSPPELLRKFDRWFSAAGYEADHPWRVSIAETMSVHDPATTSGGAGRHERVAPERASLALDAACQVSTLVRLIDNPDVDTDSYHPVLLRIKQLGDVLIAALGDEGELATKAGLTGWEVGESVRSVRKCFVAWLAKRGHTGNGERYAMAVQVKGFLEKNGDALFTAMHRATDDHRANTPFRVGFRRVVDENGEPIKLDAAQEWIDKQSTAEARAAANMRWQYLCLPESFKHEVCRGFDPVQVAHLLRDRGHLQTEGDRLTVRQRIPGIALS